MFIGCSSTRMTCVSILHESSKSVLFLRMDIATDHRSVKATLLFVNLLLHADRLLNLMTDARPWAVVPSVGATCTVHIFG